MKDWRNWLIGVLLTVIGFMIKSGIEGFSRMSSDIGVIQIQLATLNTKVDIIMKGQ